MLDFTQVVSLKLSNQELKCFSINNGIVWGVEIDTDEDEDEDDTTSVLGQAILGTMILKKTSQTDKVGFILGSSKLGQVRL